MKIECTKEKILDALYKTEKVAGKNPTLPILSCVYFETNKNLVFVRSTNLDIGVEISFPAKVLMDGSCAVWAGTLLSLLINGPDDSPVTLESTDSGLVVSLKGNSSLIKTLPKDDFPSLPKINEGKKLSLPAQSVVLGFKSVWYSCATTSIKPELSSVYVYVDGNDIVFVATDSFRLAEKKIKLGKQTEVPPILVPQKNVPEIIKILEGVDGDVEITVSPSQLSFSYKNTYLVSRTVEGNFPDYKQIIPKESKTEAVVLKQDMLNSLKLANVFSDQYKQMTVSIIPGDKLFEIKTKNSEIGENSTKIESALKGEDITISFNHRYVSDCFQSVFSDSVSLSFTGLSKPLVIRGVGDPSFLYLVMPMNK